MRIEHSDDNTLKFIDNAAMSYMLIVIDRLNQTLVEGGVGDSGKRQEICANFLFGFAYDLDAGWFLEGATKLFPKTCFAERSKSGPANGEIETLHIPTAASSWHEYAHGVVSQYFEEYGESLTDISQGSYEN